MDKSNVFLILINILKAIRKCYQEIIDIELDDSITDKNKEIVQIYKKISQFRELEDQYFFKLDEFCNSEKDIDKLVEYVLENYNVTDGIIPGYEYYLDFNIEVRRILERINTDINIMPYQILCDDQEFDSEANLEKDSIVSEEALLVPLMDEETVVAFIHKIDSILKNNETCFFSKRQLLQLKYDMFFLNRKLEGPLINDCCILPLQCVDAKNILTSTLDINDERLEKAYDENREYDILKLVEDLSQRRNQKDIFKCELRYMFIDLMFDSISDFKIADIMSKIMEQVDDSYSDSVKEARLNVFERLAHTYKERMQESSMEEIIDEADFETICESSTAKVFEKTSKNN